METQEARPPDDPRVETLFRAHATTLFRLAFLSSGDRAVAEDVVQEAFLRFMDHVDAPAPGAELAYLRRIVFNLLIGRHRKATVARRHLRLDPAEAGPAADATAEQRGTQRRVVQAVQRLPERQRHCIVLRLYGEATDGEIAASLGISAGSVKRHLHRARVTLAKELEDLR
jgi:RNA polymerase sigma factor (sigma-70 family)